MSKLNYLLQSVLKMPATKRQCPACESTNVSLVKRKYVVTSLYHCNNCHVRFRLPHTEDAAWLQFYQKAYTQGFTTDLPSEADLAELLRTNFAGGEKDFSAVIAMLKRLGLQAGSTILDFGASWGYCSYQFRQAGFKVYSHEIGAPRAQYAKEKLGCTMIDNLDNLPEQVDCFFSSHVIEHLADPNLIWRQAAKWVKPKGLVVTLTPNGDPVAQTENEAQYHQLWGEVHPILLTEQAFLLMAEKHGFKGYVHSKPYSEDLLSKRTLPLKLGEIVCVAQRP
jgi:2-polyprenyl-3-methyl-5-hydroxy-6-metoxy-1,4-benzoquinol methylase